MQVLFGTYRLLSNFFFISDIFQINKIRIEQIKLYFDKNRNIDLRGYCLLNIKPNIRCYLEWGIGLPYKNCIEIWSEENI